MEPQAHNLDLFADYFQFYVCDGQSETDTGMLWDQIATDRMLAAGPDLVAVGTARNMDVPVTIEILSREPASDVADWDQVIECGVMFASGTVMAFGCTDYRPDAARFAVEPGTYRARVSYADLDDLSDDGLDGNDRYRVQLWPGPAGPIAVIKQRAL